MIRLDETCDSSWQNLAYAIIKSGYKSKDKSFLESEWCDNLKYFCSLKLRGFDGNLYVDNRNAVR